MLIIQHIETHWTKASRGMPGAGKRNAVPKKLQIPAVVTDSNGMLIHHVTAREENNFVLEQKTEIVEHATRYWTVAFQKTHDTVQVLFTYNTILHGLPKRNACKRPLFKLAPGKWGSFHINGRFASYSGQMYIQHVLNIGHGTACNPDWFLQSDSDIHVNELGHLF